MYTLYILICMNIYTNTYYFQYNIKIMKYFVFMSMFFFFFKHNNNKKIYIFYYLSLWTHTKPVGCAHDSTFYLRKPTQTLWSFQ